MGSGLFDRLYGFDGANPVANDNPLPVMIGNTGSKTPFLTLVYCVPYFTPYATPTDVIQLYNNYGTGALRINKITISSTQTTTGYNQWFLIQRTTANIGGSVTVIPPTKLDPSDTSTSSICNLYTAIPSSLGTNGGTVVSPNILTPAAGSLYEATFDIYNDQYAMGANPIISRSATQQICINFNGAAVPAGLSCTFSIFCTYNT